MKPVINKTKDVKIVFVGESAVGKTSIINIANTGEMDYSICPTVGASFVVNKYDMENVQIKLNIWDTAGQEKYRSLVPMYYRDISVAFIVYSIDNRSSFMAVDNWVEGILSEIDYKPKLFLLGNKSDLAEYRKVSYSEGDEKATKIGARFLEVSAVQNKAAIMDLFKLIADEAAEEYTQTTLNRAIIIEEPVEKETKNCCGK